jgi:hypothetical protein
MDFSYIEDDRWDTLDPAMQKQMIDLAFNNEVTSDSRWTELDEQQQSAMKQDYQTQAQQTIEQTKAPVEDDSAPGVFETVGKGLAHGSLGLVEAVGTGVEYAGQRVGSETLTKAGRATKDIYGKAAADYRPSKAIEGKNVWDNPELLKNAEYWLYNVSDMVPMLAASVIPGAGAAKALSLAGAAPKLAMLGGSIVGGGFGGAVEGAQTYNAVLAKGGTEQEAARSAELMTIGAGVLNALGISKVLAKAGTGFKAKVIKTMGAAAWEGFTEGLEEPTEVFSKYLGSYLAGEELPTDLKTQLIDSAKAALTVAPIAALTGGGGNVLSDLTYTPPETIQNAKTAGDAVAAAEEEIDSVLKAPAAEVAPVEAAPLESIPSPDLVETTPETVVESPITEETAIVPEAPAEVVPTALDIERQEVEAKLSLGEFIPEEQLRKFPDLVPEEQIPAEKPIKPEIVEEMPAVELMPEEVLQEEVVTEPEEVITDPIESEPVIEEELFPHERKDIEDLISTRAEALANLKTPNEADQTMITKLKSWKKSIAEKSATDMDLQTWKNEALDDVMRAQKEQQAKTPQYQAGERPPGEGVSLKDIQAQFKGQNVFIGPNKEVSVAFDNGQGITITHIKDFENGDREIAIESGQMGEEGTILGMTEGSKITLSRDLADPETLAHEMTHTLKNLGILTKQDEQVLFLELNKLSQKGGFRYARSAMKDAKMAREEDLANVLAQVLTDRKAYQGTTIGKIIQKVTDFIDNLMKFGGPSTVKLAKEIESGKIFGRKTQKPQTLRGQFQTTEAQSSQPFDVPAGSTKAESFNYGIIDVLAPVSKVYKEIKNEITEEQDYLLKERLRRNKSGAAIKKAKKELAEPIRDLMAENNFKAEQVDEALYGRHAIEANARLRLTNARRFLLDLAETNEKEGLQAKIDAIDETMSNLDMPNSATQKAYLALLEKELQYTVSADTKKIATEWNNQSPRFSGITDAEATEINNRWADDPAMQDIMKLTDKITRSTIDIALESGRITQDEYDAFKTTFKHYVPLQREGHQSQSGLFGTGQGLVNLGKDYKVRGGSTRKAINMLGNVLIQHEQAIERAGKAEAGRAFLDLIKANPNKDFWKISKKNLVNEYDASGNIFKREAYAIAPNEIPLKLDGEYHIVWMNPDNVHAMRIVNHIKGGDVQSGAIVRGLSKLNRYFATIHTGLNPEFLLTNFPKDLQIAAVNLSSTELKDMTMKVMKDVPKAALGLHDAIRKDGDSEWGQIAKEFITAGGLSAWADRGQEVEKLAKKIDREVRLQQKDLKAKTAKTTLAVLQLIGDYNSIAENAVRLAAYKNARDAGLSEAKATLLGKELTVNFEQKGLYGELYNSVYLFSSAGVQGSARLISGLIKSPKARKIVGGMIVSSIGVAIANGMLGGEDDEGKNNYANVKDHEKERNMVFVIPNSGGKVIKIPLGWGLNFFWNIGTEIGDAILAGGSDKFDYDPMEGASRLLNSGLNAFNPIQSATLRQMISPTITDPLVQVGENKNFFGAPIMPEKNKFEAVETPESQRYWKSVSPTSKAMAEFLNSISGGNKVEKGAIDISPEVLDLVYDTFTGGLGRFVSGVAGLPQELSKDEIDLTKVPLVRKFVGTLDENKGRQDYYSNTKEIKTILKKIKTYPKRRREFMRDPRFRLKESMESTERQIKALRKILKQVKAEKSRERIEKRIERIQDRFNKQFNRRIKK